MPKTASPIGTTGGPEKIMGERDQELQPDDHDSHRARREYDDTPNAASRQSLSELRGHVRQAERDVRQEIKDVDKDCRARTGKLHDEIDALERVDSAIIERVKALETASAAHKEAIDDLKDKDPAKGAPWYARPDYIRNLLLAIAAGISAVIIAWNATKHVEKATADGEKTHTEGTEKPDE